MILSMQILLPINGCPVLHFLRLGDEPVVSIHNVPTGSILYTWRLR
jgi:hypothetical protein